MATTSWNGTMVAESDETVIVEGNHYFPPESIDQAFFAPIDQTTVCSWKGTASYFDLVIGDDINRAAAWTYKDPSTAAASIKDHVAFYGSVQISA